MSKRSNGDDASHHNSTPGGPADRGPFSRWSAAATASIVLGSLLVAVAATAIYRARDPAPSDPPALPSATSRPSTVPSTVLSTLSTEATTGAENEPRPPAWLAEPPAAEALSAGTGSTIETAPPVASTSLPSGPDPEPAVLNEPLSPPIVTVLGDSTAVHIADGLRRWADTSRVMAVVERALAACSPVSTGDRPWTVARTGDDANPRHLVERDEPCRVNEIEPGTDVVLVVDHAMALVDHQRADGSWASILDEDLAGDLADSYRELASKARAMGARLVLTTAPRWLALRDDPLPPPPPADPNRTEAYNRLVRSLVSELETDFGEDTVGLLDTATILDASEYDGPYGRSDGAHLDFDRSVDFATDFLGPALLTLAGR